MCSSPSHLSCPVLCLSEYFDNALYDTGTHTQVGYLSAQLSRGCMCLSTCRNSCPRRNHHNSQRHKHSLGKKFHFSHAYHFNFINAFGIGKLILLALCVHPLKSQSRCQNNNSKGDDFKRFLTRIASVLAR